MTTTFKRAVNYLLLIQGFIAYNSSQYPPSKHFRLYRTFSNILFYTTSLLLLFVLKNVNLIFLTWLFDLQILTLTAQLPNIGRHNWIQTIWLDFITPWLDWHPLQVSTQLKGTILSKNDTFILCWSHIQMHEIWN